MSCVSRMRVSLSRCRHFVRAAPRVAACERPGCKSPYVRVCVCVYSCVLLACVGEHTYVNIATGSRRLIIHYDYNLI